MQILTPLSNRADMIPLSEAGADELYFGFRDDEWGRRFGEYSDINRMSGFRQRANSVSIDEVCETIREIHGLGMKAYVTLNAPAYSQAQLDYMEEYFRIFSGEKPDGVIVSGPAPAKMAARYGIRAVASTMCGIYNAEIARYYAEEGVQRIILPREMNLEEIAEMAEQFPQLEFEVFLMRNGCVFSDSHCLGMHSRTYGSLCSAVRHGPFAMVSDQHDFKTIHDLEWTSMLFNESYRGYACGLCAIYRLLQSHISAAKIVGRADDPKKIVSDVRLVRENLSIAGQCASEEEYLKKMRFPRDHYRMCKQGMSCYYPEVRFGKEPFNS